MNIDAISAAVATTIIEAKKHGLDVVERGAGHFQIKGGKLLVNYYPDSKKRSAYVAGTTKRYEHVSPSKAVAMAMEAPPIAAADRKAERKGRYRTEKIRLLEIWPFCRWCSRKLSIDGKTPGTRRATMDHLIPLHRGGLDNANNRKLACEPCNHKRGHDMPELKDKP